MLQNAKAVGARFAVVNGMAFDYWIGTPQEMATDTETAAEGIFSQLEALYPNVPSLLLWPKVGITEMPGIDDFGPDETFTTADATTVLKWSEQHELGQISIWALDRDNGGCPGARPGPVLRCRAVRLVLQPHLRALDARVGPG